MSARDPDLLEKLAADQPSWRAEQMSAALVAFDAQVTPTGAEEEWRYVDLGIDADDLVPATAPGEKIAPGPFLTAAREQSSGRVSIVDGVVTDMELENGEISIRRLSEMDVLVPAAPVDADKFAAAHVAFATDAIRIDVPAGTVMTRPIVVDVQATQPGMASFPHIEVGVGAEADAGVVVVYRSPEGVEMLVVPGISLEADDGGRLRFLSVQGWGEETIGLVHQRLRLGRDATGRIGEVGLGGKVGRLDLDVQLEGAGSSAEVVGLYFGEGHQTLDYRMVINHVGRNTSSDVFLKGAVEDHAQSVFTGLLRIEKDALRSSAFETNRNLVLSENAKAHSVPNLEILCDDVVCGHGSSVGPLEEEHLYYLQSRGLSRERAERLLIRGFFTEVIDRLPVPVVSGPVQEAVFRRFVAAQEEGRLR
ncbi:MAG TPA: Fe-S cluster assembly protein SufD [Acidimicrobiia bacterium]|nr:Fe-S cluster assembly protein SufD [Acidimicrobiia bacterium]